MDIYKLERQPGLILLYTQHTMSEECYNWGQRKIQSGPRLFLGVKKIFITISSR